MPRHQAMSRRALLLRGDRPEDDATLPVKVGDGCLARRGVVCQSCRDACPENAIRFRPAPGRVVAVPEIEGSACTGCGECVVACPVAAIEIKGAGRAIG